MRLLYVTYKVDLRDSLVGYVVGWINGLAPQMKRIEVVCLAAGKANLAQNVRVHSLGKDQGVSRIGRWVGFFRTVWLLRDSVEAVFCQFSPEYVLAVAPLAKWHGWPIVFWYTHRHVSWRLRLATVLADRIVTASLESFQLPTPKLRVIGHGIDTERFKPERAIQSAQPIILAVGRRSPIKNYELLIDATELLVKEYGRNDVQVRIVGGDEGNAPPDYVNQLQARIDQAKLTEMVKLIGPVPFDHIAREYQNATVSINLCPTGGMDKAVLESMALGVPTLVRNKAFKQVFGQMSNTLMIPGDDARMVSSQLHQFLGLPGTARQQLGRRLRKTVMQHYSQETLVRELADLLQPIKAW